MVDDMAAFPPDGSAVNDSIDSKVSLPAFEPCRGVVSGAERHRRHEDAVNRGFGWFALAAIEHLRNRSKALGHSKPTICSPRVPHVSLLRSDVRHPLMIRCKSCATVRSLGRAGDNIAGENWKLETGN